MTNHTIPTSVLIGSQVLKDFAVGATIEARFGAVITRKARAAGCWMCRSEDEEFRCAVGGLLLSYDPASPEFERITTEMQQLQRMHLIIVSARLGMTVEIPDPPDTFEPVGLLGLWHAREK